MKAGLDVCLAPPTVELHAHLESRSAGVAGLLDVLGALFGGVYDVGDARAAFFLDRLYCVGARSLDFGFAPGFPGD